MGMIMYSDNSDTLKEITEFFRRQNKKTTESVIYHADKRLCFFRNFSAELIKNSVL